MYRRGNCRAVLLSYHFTFSVCSLVSLNVRLRVQRPLGVIDYYSLLPFNYDSVLSTGVPHRAVLVCLFTNYRKKDIWL